MTLSYTLIACLIAAATSAKLPRTEHHIPTSPPYPVKRANARNIPRTLNTAASGIVATATTQTHPLSTQGGAAHTIRLEWTTTATNGTNGVETLFCATESDSSTITSDLARPTKSNRPWPEYEGCPNTVNIPAAVAGPATITQITTPKSFTKTVLGHNRATPGGIVLECESSRVQRYGGAGSAGAVVTHCAGSSRTLETPVIPAVNVQQDTRSQIPVGTDPVPTFASKVTEAISKACGASDGEFPLTCNPASPTQHAADVKVPVEGQSDFVKGSNNVAPKLLEFSNVTMATKMLETMEATMNAWFALPEACVQVKRKGQDEADHACHVPGAGLYHYYDGENTKGPTDTLWVGLTWEGKEVANSKFKTEDVCGALEGAADIGETIAGIFYPPAELALSGAKALINFGCDVVDTFVNS